MNQNQMDGLTFDKFDTYLERDQYPPLLVFWKFHPPGFLERAGRPGDQFNVQPIIHNIGGSNGPQGVAIQQVFNPSAFALTIAKIAYCHAVATVGLDKFCGDEIRDLIFSHRKDTFNFVGSATAHKVTISRKLLHKLTTRIQDDYLIVRVGLFSSINALPYEVVVGKRTH